MRLSESEIVAGLQHPSLHVREVVAEYLEDSYRTQSDITLHFIAAVERYGWQEFLHFPHRVASFELDANTLPWAIEQIERQDSRAPSENTRGHLTRMIANAPVDVVRPYLAQILKFDRMHEPRNRFPTRIRSMGEEMRLRDDLWNKSPDECWTLLDEHCHAVANVQDFADADIPYAELLLERIASDGPAFADRVMMKLNEIRAPKSGYEEWLIGLMIILAGRLRLEPAIAPIFRQFGLDWDWTNDEIMDALVQIGTPAVTEFVSAHYAESAAHVRIFSWGIYESIHHNASVAHILQVLPVEDDVDNRGQLGVALASHFDERGIEPALSVYREEPEDTERFAIIERLYAHACLADLDLPELAEWEAQLDAMWRRNRKSFAQVERMMTSHSQEVDDVSGDEWMEGTGVRDDDLSDDESDGIIYLGHANSREAGGWRDEHDPLPKPQPLVREAARVGRNDPCPCGSGKKYKQCCLRAKAH